MDVPASTAVLFRKNIVIESTKILVWVVNGWLVIATFFEADVYTLRQKQRRRI